MNTDSEKKKVVLIGYGGGHITILDKIAQTIVNDNDIELFIIPLNGAIPFIRKYYNEKNIYPLSKFIHLFDDAIDEIVSYGVDLLKDNFNPNIGVSKLESIFYLGLSYHELVLKTDKLEAKKTYLQRKRQAFFPMKTLMRIFDYVKPDLIITTNSPRFEAAALQAAKELKIQNLQILDLFGDDYPIPFADHIVVMNDSVKRKLVLGGNKASTFHVLGQPVLDDTIEKVKEVNTGALKKSFNLLGKPILLFSPTRNYIYNDDLSIKEELDGTLINESIFQILDEIAEKFKIQILIRPHPSDNINHYASYLESKSHYSYFPSINIYEAIAISDYVVSYNSTILVQSVICNKMAFAYNQNSGAKYHWIELMDDPFVYSSDFKELKKNLLNRIMEDRPVSTGGFFEIGAANKIKILIEELIR